MKTLLTVVLMLFVFAESHAQIKGIPFDKAVPMEDMKYNRLGDLDGMLITMDQDDGIAYLYVFEVKAKGYFDALQELGYILAANDIKRGPDADDTYLRYVNRNDYNDVVHELKSERGWIQELWSLYDDEWNIFMLGNSETISVGVVHYDSTATTETSERSKVSPPVIKIPRRYSERALYTGRANTEVTSGSEVITQGEGNQGSPGGLPDSDNYTDGMGGKGIDFSLTGRNPVSFPKPEYNVQESGTVVVTIRVNREGIVTYAEAGVQGTNTLNMDLLEAARKAALKARFNPKSDAVFTQQGTITYHFVLQ